ncbi:MAG: pilus assembly protein CpaE [Pyrinomonadaceae bacterium]|jgi:pilus assembly protein CpaE|nr:pilus assembly protein CpaE [Pyrinomonadaceae bacterium]
MTQPITLVVLSTGLDNFKEIRTAISSDNRVQLLAGGNDAEQLHGEILRLKPAAAIITLGANAEQGIKLIQRLAVESPKTALISAANNAAPDLLLESLRAGAREFLKLPISAEELKTVLDRVAEFCAGQVETPKKKGRMVAVFSSKGGCGTSFLATNLAAATNARAVLVDLNLQAGDLPLFLGVDPKYSFADMAEHRTRLDDALIKSFVTPYSSNLSLLAAPREADSADEIEPEHVFEVLQRMRETYDYVVLDPQHTFDSITLAALDQSDEIVLVLTLDIPAIRSTQRALEIFDRLGYPRKKIRIVVNRWSKQIDLDLRQVEKFLGEPVIGFVPSDYQTAVTSINLGQPLVLSDPNCKIALEIKRVARTIATGDVTVLEETQSRKSVWNSWFKREPQPSQFELAGTTDLSL